jgi:hypothetical protein
MQTAALWTLNRTVFHASASNIYFRIDEAEALTLALRCISVRVNIESAALCTYLSTDCALHVCIINTTVQRAAQPQLQQAMKLLA